MSFAEYSRAVAGGGLGRRDDPTQLLLNNIQQINYNVSQIPKLVSHLGNPTKDSQEHRARLRELIDSTKRLALDTNKGLKSIPSGAEGGEEVKIYLVRINIITKILLQERKFNKLKSDFQNCLERFQEVSKSAGRQLEIAPPPPVMLESSAGP